MESTRNFDIRDDGEYVGNKLSQQDEILVLANLLCLYGDRLGQGTSPDTLLASMKRKIAYNTLMSSNTFFRRFSIFHLVFAHLLFLYGVLVSVTCGAGLQGIAVTAVLSVAFSRVGVSIIEHPAKEYLTGDSITVTEVESNGDMENDSNIVSVMSIDGDHNLDSGNHNITAKLRSHGEICEYTAIFMAKA